jgi:cytochrome c biogenesis protein CcdA
MRRWIDKLVLIAGVALIGVVMILSVVTSVYADDITPQDIPEDAVARVVYFYAEDCPHCKTVFEEVIQPLQARCGQALEVKPVEIGEPAGYEAFVATERALTGKAGQWDIPVVVLAADAAHEDTFYIGEDAVRQNLEEQIQCIWLNGGNDWPAVPALEALSKPSEGSLGAQSPFASDDDQGVCVESGEMEEASAACAAPEPIFLLYFYKPGCQECERVSYDLRYAQERYPQLFIEKRNILEDALLARWLGEQYDVAKKKLNVAPAVVVGEHYLVGDDLTPDVLLAAVKQYAETGSEPTWNDWDPEMAKGALETQFNSWGAFTIIGAGLLDGLNPCAFATLVFFVSYLAVMKRTGKEVLLVGGAFALGIFLTYLLVGVGLWRALSALPFITKLGRWLYAVTAVLCGALAIFSYVDYFKARKGELKEMTLTLPLSLRKRINALIRRSSKARNFVIAAFVTGIFVSVIELACTGQVYLPTIMFVLGVPELRAQGALYLFLYNLMFIVPLVVVFVLVYFGTTSKDLGSFLQRRAASVKLGMALLFTVLTGWLVTLVI